MSIDPSAVPVHSARAGLDLNVALREYVHAHSVREQPVQQDLRAATSSHRWACMQIAPDQGQLLALLVRLVGARRAIEVGVYTGYSALAVALALPDDGHLLACDINDEYLRLARPFWENAGVHHKIEVRLGPALATLDARLAAGEAGQYDFAFIDADKCNYDGYYERCLELLRPGGLIALDNTLWGGRVAQAATSPETAALQALNDKLHRDARVDLSLLTVGDGLTLARKC